MARPYCERYTGDSRIFLNEQYESFSPFQPRHGILTSSAPDLVVRGNDTTQVKVSLDKGRGKKIERMRELAPRATLARMRQDSKGTCSKDRQLTALS